MPTVPPHSLAVFVEPCCSRDPLPLDLAALPALLTSLECRGIEPLCDVALALRPAMSLLELEGCKVATQQLRALVGALPQLTCLRLGGCAVVALVPQGPCNAGVTALAVRAV